MRDYIRCRIIGGGDYIRVNDYPVRPISKKRGARKNPTSDTQQKLNAENSAHRLIDLLHWNFCPDDISVDFTYKNEFMPKTVADAQRIMYNAMRRLKRIWSKKTALDSKKFKYVVVTEVSSTGRIHHHCVISGGLSMHDISDKWGFGYTKTRALEFSESGLIGLGKYITKSRTSYRRWQASKNLENPPMLERDNKVRKKDIKHMAKNPEDYAYLEKIHDGYKVCPGTLKVISVDDYGDSCFLSYSMYKIDNTSFGYDKLGRLYQKRKKE